MPAREVPSQRRSGLDIIDQEKTLSGISAIVMVCGGWGHVGGGRGVLCTMVLSLMAQHCPGCLM